ncbi:MAG: sigma-70 family RNA polymerase sigma factor [Bacteroidales bacterium]|nr:sigma-70 family RNA polymerase sigma factor [Bacteroidales bacterium]MCF8456634.1 sigma-70 family RNA polymerase sigma factor [Bacteroidales bacterium]
MELKKYTEQEVLAGILGNSSKTLQYVYKEAFPGVRKYIMSNSGNDEDAKDIFQESIIITYKKLKNNNLVLTCSLKVYLFSVCRLLWLKQLENQRKGIQEVNVGEFVLNVGEDVLDIRDQNERYELYRAHFDLLKEDCKKVLRMFLDKIPLKEIAKQMGFTEQYAKKRKFQCKETLVKSIQNDNDYKEML